MRGKFQGSFLDYGLLPPFFSPSSSPFSLPPASPGPTSYKEKHFLALINLTYQSQKGTVLSFTFTSIQYWIESVWGETFRCESF